MLWKQKETARLRETTRERVASGSDAAMRWIADTRERSLSDAARDSDLMQARKWFNANVSIVYFFFCLKAVQMLEVKAEIS